jgi:ADP-ribosylglycohydrolase
MRSCIYGLAVGDALGVPYESCERGTFECTGMVGGGTHGQLAGTWSDDTSMALCICSSIKRLAYIDVADIAYRFRQWLEHGDYTCDGRVFDVGVTCKRAISTGVPGKSYDECGNGSLMRTAPLAMFDYLDFVKVRDVSAITHAHPVAEWSCVTLCDMLWTIRNSGAPAKVDFWHRYGHIVSRPVEAVKSDGYCEHTLEAALWCFVNTGSYADCVLAAVNLGGDTDTTAAVAGALAGVYYGFEAIPPKWVGQLRGKTVIDQCI